MGPLGALSGVAMVAATMGPLAHQWGCHGGTSQLTGLPCGVMGLPRGAAGGGVATWGHGVATTGP